MDTNKSKDLKLVRNTILDKKYLLVSNRGDENIVIYYLNDNNNNNQVLSIKGYLDIHGLGPRYFTFDPTVSTIDISWQIIMLEEISG
ncbi:unnamed protein product [Rotaria sp. Silwood1]|nr:unnamed protein product [Rotaria sp. Silwood1]